MNSAQKIFPVITLVVGLLYVFINPPLQAPDEMNHFCRIIQIAQGDFIPEKRGHRTGGVIPGSVVRIGEIFTQKIAHFPENKLTRNHFLQAQQLQLNPQDTLYYSFPNSSLYSPVSYLPQLLLATPALHLELPPLWIIYCGRISSVLFCVLLLTFAIYLLPGFHWLFFAVVLLPMFCFQMASLSADAFLNTLALLLFALAMRVLFPAPALTRKNVLLIFSVFFFLAWCKTGYLFLALFFLLPLFSEPLQKKRWLFLTGALLVSGGIIVLLWSFVVKATYSPYGHPDTNPDLAIAFIKADPLRFAGMVLQNVFKHLPFYFYSTVGYLGWLDTKLPLYVPLLYWFMLLIIAISEQRGQFEFSAWQYFIMFTVSVAVCLLVIVSQYLVGSAAGSLYIERSQGRYFLPVLLPLLFILRAKRFAFFPAQRVEALLPKVVPAVALFCAVVAFSAIISRYYFA